MCSPHQVSWLAGMGMSTGHFKQIEDNAHKVNAELEMGVLTRILTVAMSLPGAWGVIPSSSVIAGRALIELVHEPQQCHHRRMAMVSGSLHIDTPYLLSWLVYYFYLASSSILVPEMGISPLPRRSERRCTLWQQHPPSQEYHRTMVKLLKND